MNATSLPSPAVKTQAYIALQRQMHDALLAQHPEWILPNGECPTCDSYEARLAELLIQPQYEMPKHPRVTTTHHI